MSIEEKEKIDPRDAAHAAADTTFCLFVSNKQWRQLVLPGGGKREEKKRRDMTRNRFRPFVGVVVPLFTL